MHHLTLDNLGDLGHLTEGDDPAQHDAALITFGVTQLQASVEGSRQLPHSTLPSYPSARLYNSAIPSKNSSASTLVGFHSPRGRSATWRATASRTSSGGGLS